ncbi:hypothetical protein Tco_0601537 [Tanacetum coccineum]
MAYVNSTPSGFVSISSATEPSIQDDPSINKVHGSGNSSGSAMSSSRDSSSGRCERMNQMMLANNLKVLPMLNAPDQTSDPRKGGDCHGVVVWRRGGGVRGVGIEAVLAAGWRRDGDDGGMMMMMEVAGCGCQRGGGAAQCVEASGVVGWVDRKKRNTF